MSSGSLFDSEPDKASGRKTIVIGIVALFVLVGLAYAIVQYSRPADRAARDLLAEKVRDSTVLMLQYSTFSGEEFRSQVLGSGRLERYIKVNDEAFFTFPEAPEGEFTGFVSKYFHDPAKVEFGRLEDGVIRLGDYKYPASPYVAHFFRTSLGNIKIEPDQTLTFPYATVNYTLSLEEMNNFINNSQLYGGRVVTMEAQRTNRPMTIFANHGIMVARQDEPSLKRLTDELLKDVGPSREARIQRLVDFVSAEIEYSFSEAVGSRETLKRPSETLMTRSGDCSNKTILLASMLEQIGEEYLILYCPQHITVAVPRGDYANDNQLDFTWDDRSWMIAETTLAGFQVGTTLVNDMARLQTVRYVQDPKHMDVIFDANSYEVLRFF